MGELFQKLDASQLVDDFADLPRVAGNITNPPGQEAHKPGLDRVRLWRAGGGVAGVGHQGRSSNPEQAVSLGFSRVKSHRREAALIANLARALVEQLRGLAFGRKAVT